MTNPEIAKSLGVSANTVRFHLKSIFGKIRVSNRTEAAA
jgi:DNA-binding CsgD family transcriptional regulator